MVDSKKAASSDARSSNLSSSKTPTASSSSSSSGGGIQEVTIHPLVLLSAADHYHRVARGTRKRVVGVLLGQVFQGQVDATNSFAVPFEEDSRNPSVFYLDHNFLESMLFMFRKVNAKERVVGFYSTGPQIRPNDLKIHDMVQRFVPTMHPPTASSEASADPSPMAMPTASRIVFCIIDIRPDRTDLPVTAYKVVEEVSAGTTSQSRVVQRTFAHVPCQMGAMEAEEVGVEHLLRDINDPTISTVAALIAGKMAGLETLTGKLVEIKDYLQQAGQGRLPQVHPEILANVQTIWNLLPNLNRPEFLHSLMVKTNDMHLAMYLAALIRTVLALHDLVNNKIRYGPAGFSALEATTTTPSVMTKKNEEEKKEETKDAATGDNNTKNGKDGAAEK